MDSPSLIIVGAFYFRLCKPSKHLSMSGSVCAIKSLQHVFEYTHGYHKLCTSMLVVTILGKYVFVCMCIDTCTLVSAKCVYSIVFECTSANHPFKYHYMTELRCVGCLYIYIYIYIYIYACRYHLWKHHVQKLVGANMFGYTNIQIWFSFARCRFRGRTAFCFVSSRIQIHSWLVRICHRIFSGSDIGTLFPASDRPNKEQRWLTCATVTNGKLLLSSSGVDKILMLSESCPSSFLLASDFQDVRGNNFLSAYPSVVLTTRCVCRQGLFVPFVEISVYFRDKLRLC